MIFRAFSTKGKCGKRKKTQVNEVVGKTSPVGEVCLIMEAVTVESRGHSGGWPQRWAKYDSWFFVACFILVMPRFHKFPSAVVMDCGGTEWAGGYWV